jgi:hypothetical protein
MGPMQLLRLLGWTPRPAGADELRAMNDRDLKDLGIGRGEVDYWLGEELHRLEEVRVKPAHGQAFLAPQHA